MRDVNDSGWVQGADDFGAFVAVRPSPCRSSEGPLRGKSIAVKDNISVAGMPYTAGHPLFAQRLATSDAPAVSRLRDAGAHIAGVTRTDAGGFGVVTPGVRNPRAPSTIVGGSSGGSAAAVAAGLADIGLGTDTGGSVRIPAACCGLYAFKPSYGKVPLEGVWPMAPSLDHVGLMTRELRLLRTAAAVLLQEELALDCAAPRYGVDVRALHGADPAVAAQFLRLIVALRATGAHVEELELPDRMSTGEAHAVQVLAEARRVYEPWWPLREQDLGAGAHRALTLALRLDMATVAEAQAAAENVKRQIQGLLARVDALLVPTLAVRPPAIGTRRIVLDGKSVSVVTALTAQTALANLTGAPALVLPLPGLPGSVQLLAAPQVDAALFAYGFHLNSVLQEALAAAPEETDRPEILQGSRSRVGAVTPPRAASEVKMKETT